MPACLPGSRKRWLPTAMRSSPASSRISTTPTCSWGSVAANQAAGLRTAKLIKEARLQVVKDGPHCITGTQAEVFNAGLLSLLGEKAGKSQTETA